MKAKILMILMVLMLMILVVGCNQKHELAPSSNYGEYNKVINEYAKSVIAEDYYTMKQYLHPSSLEDRVEIKNATKTTKPLDTEKLEKMGDYLGIYGFDYFYDQYREIYYSVQYKNFRSGHDKQPLIFLLKEVEGEIFVMNVSGSGNLHHSKHHLDDIDGKFTPVGVKEVMDRYAANTFAVKEYPEKS